MNEEKYRNWSIVLQAIIATGVVIAATSLWLAYWGISEDHERERRKYAAQLIEKVSNELNRQRPNLIASFPEMFDEAKTSPLSMIDAKNLFNACGKSTPQNTEGRMFDCDARKAAGSRLNLLDSVASAHWNHVADRVMIETSLGDLLLEHYKFFENLIKHIESVKGGRVLEDLQNVVNYIRNKKTNVGYGPEETGK